MNILKSLNLAEPEAKVTERLIGLLSANNGIDLKLLEIDGNNLTISVTQSRVTNGIIWTQGELCERASGVLSHVAKQYKIHFRAVVFIPDLSVVKADWIYHQMSDLGLKQRDVCKQLGLDKSTLSEFLSGSKQLTKIHRSLFWHYFHFYQVTRDFVDYMNREE